MATAALYPSVLDLSQSPAPADGVYTITLDQQRDAEDAIGDVLADVNQAGNPDEHLKLYKVPHITWLASKFFELPAGFVSLDASKPWLMFWTLQSFDLLGVPLDQGTKQRAVNTVLAFQHPSGGFGGGPANSHLPHLLPNWASVCSLAQTGSAAPGGGWDSLAKGRQGMYDFFMRCKQPNGGFVVCDGGEIDVRGTYCLLAAATLLDILTPELLHNVDKFIAGCQTYEGGFACASWAFGGDDTDHRAAMAEAHGGYTSCSLASHFLLTSVVPKGVKLSSLDPSFPKPIDIESAIRWSAFMQGEAGEAGGLRGRTNKLVDGCYGWWVGGGFPVLEALRKGEQGEKASRIVPVDDDGNDEWTDEASMLHLFNRVALQEYVLLAAQSPDGGLRDKPGKRPDPYHTCNNLSGLSVAQHHMTHSPSKVEKNRAAFDSTKGLPPVKPTKPEGGWKSEEERQRARREAYANALGWLEDEAGANVVGGKDNRVNATTPVFNMINLRVEPFVKYFYGQAYRV